MHLPTIWEKTHPAGKGPGLVQSPMKIWNLDTPAVLVQVAVMERNLRRLAEYCTAHGLSLCPHTKTHKIPELARRQVEYGAVAVTVAKLGEAEVMVDAGLEDILVAYPLYGEAKWRRLVALARRARITVGLDSLEVAAPISECAKREGVRVGVLVEFNTGFRRCGFPVEPSSLATVRRIRELPGVDFRGVMVYPGHFLKAPEERERLLEKENGRLAALRELFDSEGIPCGVVSGGSTPTAYMSHRFQWVNQIRPGTYIFNDRNTVGCGASSWEDCGLTVLTTVVSTSVTGRAIIDGGSKTFSGDRLSTGDGEGFGRIVEDPAIRFVAQSEEHGHLDLERARLRLKVGDRLRVIPNHVCACVNMHDRIYGVDGEDVVAQWNVAGRGRVQ